MEVSWARLALSGPGTVVGVPGWCSSRAGVRDSWLGLGIWSESWRQGAYLRPHWSVGIRGHCRPLEGGMETAFRDKDLMAMCEVPGAATQRVAVVPLQVPVHGGCLLAPGSHFYWGQ